MRSEGKPEIYVTNNWFLFHENSETHRLILVKNFLTKNNVSKVENPPLTPSDFYLFSGLKSAQKGRFFCGAAHSFKNATTETRRLSQNGFQEYFQYFYSSCHKCVFAQGDSSGGTAA